MPTSTKLSSRHLVRLIFPLLSLAAACTTSSSKPAVDAEASAGAASSSQDPAPSQPSPVRASNHPTVQASLGSPTTLAVMEMRLDEAGPLTAETVASARWESARSGLINLNHTRAQGLEDGPEAIQIYFHALKHPTRGLFIIDTGVESALASNDHPLRTSAVGQAFNFGALRADAPLGSWLEDKQLSGVFLTHLHLDHVLGLQDVPREVPIFIGPTETALESPFHSYTQSTVDGLLEGRAALAEWKFDDARVIDVFGDASLFALGVPGHTPGSVAFVARTTEGAVLFTGDVCHTTWGWQNDVEPGTFSHDGAANAESLAHLRALAARHPKMAVRLGHQSL